MESGYYTGNSDNCPFPAEPLYEKVEGKDGVCDVET